MLKIVVLTVLLGSEVCWSKLRSEQQQVNQKADAAFIDRVHELAYDLAKETVIHDNQVVWSPYSVVNILPLINSDNDSLKESFNSSLQHLREIEGLYINRVSVALTNRSVNGEAYNTKVSSLPSDPSARDELIQTSFRNEAMYVRELVRSDTIGPEIPSVPVEEGILDNATEIYLTSLTVAADWEIPFHYGNSRLGRFYINSTHAVKTKYMSNVGYYKVAELEDLNATVLALPLKDAPDVFFIIVLPHSKDGLEQVSGAMGQRNVSDILDGMKTKRVLLRLPKIQVDNQLIFNAGNNSKVIQRGSLQLTYQGIQNIAERLPQQRIKFKQLKRRGGLNIRVENPFIFMVYEKSKGGILNYGEVLIPSEGPAKPQIKYQQNYLSQNGKILSEAIDKLGDDLYTSLRKRNSGSFVFSPLSLTNLIGSLLPGASEGTRMGILSKLNFPLMWQDALTELNREGKINGSTNRASILVNGEPKQSYQEQVAKFGATVIRRQQRDFTDNYTVGSILGASDYEINPQFKQDYKKINSLFYRNERDAENVTFLEFYTPGFKYLYVPFWDAKIMSVPINGGRNQSLLLVVPGERSGLNLIEEGLTDYPISKLLCQGHVRGAFVRLRLPLLNLNYVSDFTQDLRDLEMPQFQSGDFSGITENGKLDRIVQRAALNLEQAPVEEDKESSPDKAPSVKTASVAQLNNAPGKASARAQRAGHHSKLPPGKKAGGPGRRGGGKLVKIDRPFIFYIQDARVGTVLVGRYTGPEDTTQLPAVESA